MTSRDLPLKPVAIGDLRPTQITVGFREVQLKRKQWREHAKDGDDFLERHMIPAVIGPKQRHYVLDHHHLVLALHQEGVDDILVSVHADLSGLAKGAFWTYLDNVSWCHPYDAEGVRRDFGAIPTKVSGLTDDPFRSLAGELRRAGGFAKTTTPFSEFLWADFLRRRIKPGSMDKNFASCLVKALELARDKEAEYLPGWCGPDPIG